MLILGSIDSIVSFTIDYVSYVSQNSANTNTGKEVLALSLTYVPKTFDWWIFIVAILLFKAAMVHYCTRASKQKRKLEMMQLFV